MKTAKTFEEQLEIFESRGLEIPDRELALAHLASANYFRLSGYRHPFLEDDRFRDGVTFDELWALYRFDHQFRLLLMDVIERCEIAFRTRWAYELAHRAGPQSYEDPGLHRDPKIHAACLRKIDQEINRSHEDFLGPYRKGETPGRPPIWMVCEVMSLGLLSNTLRNLRAASHRRAIADPFGLDEGVFTSFLHHLTLVRNFCAHHARVWNRRMTITFRLPKTKPHEVLNLLNSSDDRRIYNTLIILSFLINRIEPENHWTIRLRALLDAAPIDVTSHMGFLPGLSGFPASISP